MAKDVGYDYAYGPDMAHDGVAPKRFNYLQVILIDRLRGAIERLNPAVLPAIGTFTECL